MTILSNLTKLKKNRKIIGRGGDRGGTSGKGNKGQKARSGGGVRTQFEGGQTPLVRRLPKRGFNNFEFKKIYNIISFDFLKKISSEVGSEFVTKDHFIKYGIIKKSNEKVKILSNGDLDILINVEVDSCSESAKKKIESLGGIVKIVAN